MIDIRNVTLAQCMEVLEARRQLLGAELQDYSRPVPACDADFNSLLAERAALTEALTHLRALSRGEIRIPHPREEIESLVAH